MRDYLLTRLQILEAEEKAAWAQLNFVLGRKQEVEELLPVLQGNSISTEEKSENLSPPDQSGRKK